MSNEHVEELQFALQLRDLGKTFGAIRVLGDVTFNVMKGSIHGLVGENGAGKSTLVKILDGQYPAGTYDGAIWVNGEIVEMSSSRDASSRGIAVVPQETSVLENMTVAENIVVGSLPPWRLVRKKALFSQIGAFLASVNIDLEPQMVVEHLSMSSKQLLMIARSLYQKPTVLLLDEPTTALTETEMNNLHSLVRALASDGVTIIIVSHKLEEIVSLCDTVSVLRDGKLVDVVPASELEPTRLVKSMTGRSIDDLYPRDKALPSQRVVLVARDIQVQHPSVPGRKVVDGLSFELRAGEVLGVGGPLGAGRSELLLALMGVLARQGDVELDGVALPALKPGLAVRRGMGLLSEDRKATGLLFNMENGDNVTISAIKKFTNRGTVSRNRQRDAAQTFIQKFSIAGASPVSRPGELSGGNQQKLLLARAILPSPLVLLLDEPTKGVDIGAKADIYRTIHNLSAEGVGIIIVSSEVPELLGNCHRVIIMNQGRAVAEHESSATTHQQLLEAIMSTTFTDHRREGTDA